MVNADFYSALIQLVVKDASFSSYLRNLTISMQEANLKSQLLSKEIQTLKKELVKVNIKIEQAPNIRSGSVLNRLRLEQALLHCRLNDCNHQLEKMVEEMKLLLESLLVARMTAMGQFQN